MPAFTIPIHEHGTKGEPNYPHPIGGAGAAKKKPMRPHEPDTTVQAEANQYAKQLGLKPVVHDYVQVDQTRAGRIADLYDALPADDRKNPAVARAYTALASEVQAQWDFARQQGMEFLPWTKAGQPYQTSAEMAEDVKLNRRLYFFTGGEPHPFLGSPDAQGLTLNDKFRAIHDYFGHAAGGYGFGPRGEENAWRAHSQMFSIEARRAMTTETRGQNSWVNFGRHNYDAAGTYKNIPPAERPYAQQKVALLPEEFVRMDQEKTTEAKPQPTGFTRKPAELKDEDETVYRRPPKPAKKG